MVIGGRGCAPKRAAAADTCARSALFISHANPEDNPFTLWLGAKLEALGYEVWGDIMRLRGGDDWQRKLEDAIRRRACKVLLVGTRASVDKQGVRNEIQIAHDVGNAIKDKEFIIPLRLEPFDAPFLVAHAQFIDFEGSWASGMAELITALEAYGVPHEVEADNSVWRELQLVSGKPVARFPEALISNWLTVLIPKTIKLYDFKAGISIDLADARMASSPWPLVRHLRGFLSFAGIEELQEHFGEKLPLSTVAVRESHDFIDNGWPLHRIERLDARTKSAELTHKAVDRFFATRGMNRFEFADGQAAWWTPFEAAPKGKVSFKWASLTGLRQIQGVSVKRGLHWHLAISLAFRSRPVRHMHVASHVIFSHDGKNLLLDSARMHRMRRSFTKSWRNARWRDMLLAFLSWVSSGESEVSVPAGANENFVLVLPPMLFKSPVSIQSASDEDLDEEQEIDDSDTDEDGIMAWADEDYDAV